MRLPHWVEEVLKLEPEIAKMTQGLGDVRDYLYLGRGINYPIALEGR